MAKNDPPIIENAIQQSQWHRQKLVNQDWSWLDVERFQPVLEDNPQFKEALRALS